jgi:hypothetical protein
MRLYLPVGSRASLLLHMLLLQLLPLAQLLLQRQEVTNLLVNLLL